MAYPSPTTTHLIACILFRCASYLLSALTETHLKRMHATAGSHCTPPSLPLLSALPPLPLPFFFSSCHKSNSLSFQVCFSNNCCSSKWNLIKSLIRKTGSKCETAQSFLKGGISMLTERNYPMWNFLVGLQQEL